MPSLISALALNTALLGFAPQPSGPFDSAQRYVSQALGYRWGSRITTYRDQERVLEKLVSESMGCAQRIDFGTSNNNFPLRVYAISSASNISRLAEIRESIERAAKAGKTPPPETPVIVWINETIHGNEPASFESAMVFAAALIRGQSGQEEGMVPKLDNVIVMLNPVYNPDGHERYAVAYNAFARGDFGPGSYEQMESPLTTGRLNHYRFDMNRDRVAFSQVETRSEVKLMLSWRPQVYVDQHGQTENFFFPPNPQSINANTDRSRINKWTQILGRECGAAFDQQGWTYFVREEFDLYYPGYLDSHTSLSGAIGMTHETDGGKSLFTPRADGTVIALSESALKHTTAAVAVVRAASKNSSALWTDWAKFKEGWVTGKSAGKFKRVLVNGEPGDINRFAEVLHRTGIEFKFSDAKHTQNAVPYGEDDATKTTFEPGTLVIDIAQENGAIAKALLELNSDFEPEFAERQRNGAHEFYDMTGWSLPLAHGLRAYWSDSTPPVSGLPFRSIPKGMAKMGSVGVAIKYKSEQDVLAVISLLSAGVRVNVATQEMLLDGQKIEKGSFLILNSRNTELESKLDGVLAMHPYANVVPLTTSFPDGETNAGPGNRMRPLQKPKIGVIFGTRDRVGSIAGTWFTLEKDWQLRFTALNAASLNATTLSEFTAILVPQGTGAFANSQFKSWIQQGGVAVSLGDDAATGSKLLGLETGSSFQEMPGSIFTASLDLDSEFSAGYTSERIAVPVVGSSTKKRKENSVISFDDKTTLLSGWTWGDSVTKSLDATTWMHADSVGDGTIVWFSFDPLDRAMWPGFHKLVLNSMLFGPKR